MAPDAPHDPQPPPLPPPQHDRYDELYTRHLMCRYRSKVCTNPRAFKRSGALHRYCEVHRERANTNQKLWAKRRVRQWETT